MSKSKSHSRATAKSRAPGKGAERIIPAATRLFAERGFAGVTTREIADASGLNISTVHHHVGVKRELYLAVLRSIDLEEQEMIGSFSAAADDATLRNPARLRALFLTLVDHLLDAIRSNPDRARLYMRRWLEPPDELVAEEAALSLALYEKVHRVLVRAQKLGVVRSDLDTWTFLRSFAWLMYGYFASGPMSPKAWRGDPHKPSNLRIFREHLHAYLLRMLGIDLKSSTKKAKKQISAKRLA